MQTQTGSKTSRNATSQRRRRTVTWLTKKELEAYLLTKETLRRIKQCVRTQT
jgi:hypothetical protein